MKQEISPSPRGDSKPGGVSSSSTPSGLRAATKSKNLPHKSETRNENAHGVLQSPKARAKSVSTDTTNPSSNQRSIRRHLVVNKHKSEASESVAAAASSSSSQAVGRYGNRPVGEQFARPRRQRLTADHNSNCNGANEGGDDLDVKKMRELQEKLEQSKIVIGNLQAEVLQLKEQLEKSQGWNAQLQLHNSKLSEDLAAATAKIVTLATSDQDSLAEYKSPRFKDIQKLIATKLEHSKLKNEAINDASPARAAPTQPIPIASDTNRNVPACHSPPPPPPPQPRAPAKAATTPKASSVVESYHSKTKLDMTKKTTGSGNSSKPMAMSAHSSIVGEIQKRSGHLLAIKVDIETKGEFINSLIQKVLDASYTDIEDVTKFVDWLDNQLSSLADERAVLKHFNWPEKKADAMREAAVEYRGLKLLVSEFASYRDDAFASIPCGVALKKMAGLLDKSEQSIQKMTKLRNSVTFSYQQFRIPIDWMLDSGIISKIKLASIMLAKIYIKRVTLELESVQYSERESTQEGLLLQGVHFAYRAQQFAGGLDSETLCAFEEIRRRVPGHLRGSQELLAAIPSS